MNQKILKIVFFVFSLALANTSGASEVKEWYGTLTTDSHPIASCKVQEVGTYIFRAEMLWGPQEANKHFKAAKYRVAEGALEEKLREYVQSKGFNAILGFQVTSSLGFGPFANGQVVNGVAGIGSHYMAVRGTPVKLKCN